MFILGGKKTHHFTELQRSSENIYTADSIYNVNPIMNRNTSFDINSGIVGASGWPSRRPTSRLDVRSCDSPRWATLWFNAVY